MTGALRGPSRTGSGQIHLCSRVGSDFRERVALKQTRASKAVGWDKMRQEGMCTARQPVLW